MTVPLPLPETSAVVILKRKAEQVQRKTGNVDAKCLYDAEKKVLKTIISLCLVRPFCESMSSYLALSLMTQIIHQVSTVYMQPITYKVV